MIRNALCMSVLLITIAAALTSYGVVPERVHAVEDSKQAKYEKAVSFMKSSMAMEKLPNAEPIMRLHL
jgi:hypothetical protein